MRFVVYLCFFVVHRVLMVCLFFVVCLRLFVESGVEVAFLRGGEGDNLLDARGDTKKEGGIADVF